MCNVLLEKDREDQLNRLCVKEQSNILYEIIKRKANWIGHILRRNCLLRKFIEGKIKPGIEVPERWGRRRRKLLSDVKERRGYSHLTEEALDRNMWRARFRRCFGPVVRQTAKYMYVCMFIAIKYFFPCSSVFFAGTLSRLFGILPPRYLSLQIDRMFVSLCTQLSIACLS
jgi:hypothetical protein